MALGSFLRLEAGGIAHDFDGPMPDTAPFKPVAYTPQVGAAFAVQVVFGAGQGKAVAVQGSVLTRGEGTEAAPTRPWSAQAAGIR